MADQEVIVLDQEQMLKLWLYDKLQAHALTEEEADAIWNKHRDTAQKMANYGATLDDTKSIYNLARDMRTPLGRVYFKNYGGKPHVVLKGNPRLRSVLTGTRYGITNAKVVGMGLGRHGVVKSAKGGTVITIVLLTAYNIVDYVVRDEATLGGLLGAIAADVTKAAIAGAIGAAVGTLAAGTIVFGTFALGPLVVAVGVGLIAGYLLDKIDSRFQLTQKLQRLFEQGMERLDHAVQEHKQSLMRRGANVLGGLADVVIDLAVDAVLAEARRRVRPLLWRLVPTLR